jgi:hypothetical protein
MEDFIVDLGKGVFRLLTFFFAEIVFATIFFWIGFPICKVISVGHYPSSDDLTLFGSGFDQGNIWCCMVGLLAILLSVLYFTGQFS